MQRLWSISSMNWNHFITVAIFPNFYTFKKLFVRFWNLNWWLRYYICKGSRWLVLIHSPIFDEIFYFAFYDQHIQYQSLTLTSTITVKSLVHINTSIYRRPDWKLWRARQILWTLGCLKSVRYSKIIVVDIFCLSWPQKSLWYRRQCKQIIFHVCTCTCKVTCNFSWKMC